MTACYVGAIASVCHSMLILGFAVFTGECADMTGPLLSSHQQPKRGNAESAIIQGPRIRPSILVKSTFPRGNPTPKIATDRAPTGDQELARSLPPGNKVSPMITSTALVKGPKDAV